MVDRLFLHFGRRLLEGSDERRAEALYFCNDEIKEGANPRRALQVAVHEQVEGRHEFQPDIEQAYEFAFSISDVD